MVRTKRRYLVLRVQYDKQTMTHLNSTTEERIHSAIRRTIQDLYGDTGFGSYAMNLEIKYWNPYTSICFLRCPRDFHKQVRTAVTFTRFINENLCAIHCMFLAATLKSAEKFLLNYNTEKMNILLKKCKRPGEKRAILEKMQELEIENIIQDDKEDSDSEAYT